MTFIRKWHLQNQLPDDSDSAHDYSEYSRVVSPSDHQTWTIQIPDDTSEGFLDLHQAGKHWKRDPSRRGKRSSYRISFLRKTTRSTSINSGL